MKKSKNEIVFACVRVTFAALLLNWLVRPETGLWTTMLLLIMYVAQEIEDYFRNKQADKMTWRIDGLREYLKELQAMEKIRLENVNKIYAEIEAIKKLVNIRMGNKV